MTNIIVVEDQGVVRAGLCQLLKMDETVKVVGIAENGKKALELLSSGIQADILLTDLYLGDMTGIEIAQQFITQMPSIKVILLTMETDERYISEAFRAGIKGYLLKETCVDELFYGIHKVSQNCCFICTGLTGMLSQRLAKEFSSRQYPENTVELSRREAEILDLLSNGYTNLEIADKLFTSRRTVEGHRQSLLNKAGVRNTPQLIKFAMQHGLIQLSAVN